ncbi:MAG: hypothetical protein V2J51_06830 [Erythrobacter sp.]|nr:hypothetical protein [Erythrobacter sp.]
MAGALAVILRHLAAAIARDGIALGIAAITNFGDGGRTFFEALCRLARIARFGVFGRCSLPVTKGSDNAGKDGFTFAAPSTEEGRSLVRRG